MRDLAIEHAVRDDADGFAVVLEHGVRELAHHADARAAVHEADAPLGERATESARGVREDGARAGARSAKHAKPRHRAAL